MEKWDVYDEKRNPLNRTHTRGTEMVLGENHIVVDVWTVNSDNEILLTLRDPDKEIYPDLWENTGGSIVTGETSRSGAVRELFEETGIHAKEEELVFLGTKKEVTAFVDTYIVRKDLSLSELTMQKGETADAKWVTIHQLDKMIENGEIASPVAERLEPLRKSFEKFLFDSGADEA